MKIAIAYGRGHLPIELPDNAAVIEPSLQPGLVNEQAAVVRALDQPNGAKPFRELVPCARRICVVHTDITRATPNERLIPWLLGYLAEAGASREQIVLLNGLGSHRPNTRAELVQMLTEEIVSRYRCINHEPHRRDAHVQLGVTSDGTPALLNRELIDADLRIITGFIEPHFFAGFSGGPKGIMPGVAALETITSNHGAHHIASPHAAFGVTIGNPIWEEMRDIACRAGFSFLLNVALNEQRQITGVFAGEMSAAHADGIEFVRRSAMQPVTAPFDIVVTTNSGYPLDMNLYQAVKGMAAAARIVKERGTIILAAECSEGVPAGSPHDQFLRSTQDGADVLRRLAEPGFSRPEQWQAQIQALIQRRAAIHLFSSLPDDVVRAAHLEPCHDIAQLVAELAAKNGGGARIAVLPQGPLTIPYLAGTPTQTDSLSVSRARRA
jgi:nickel-dependent lactate racemase